MPSLRKKRRKLAQMAGTIVGIIPYAIIAIVKEVQIKHAKRGFRNLLWAESIANFGLDSYEESKFVRLAYTKKSLRSYKSLYSLFRKDFLKYKKVRRRLRGRTLEEKARYLVKLLRAGNKTGKLCPGYYDRRILSPRKMRKLIINGKLQKLLFDRDSLLPR